MRHISRKPLLMILFATLMASTGDGVSIVAFPWLVMQPAMGLGIAASKTPAPFRNCVRSLGNHAVFGLGLFLSAGLIGWLSR